MPGEYGAALAVDSGILNLACNKHRPMRAVIHLRAAAAFPVNVAQAHRLGVRKSAVFLVGRAEVEVHPLITVYARVEWPERLPCLVLMVGPSNRPLNLVC